MTRPRRALRLALLLLLSPAMTGAGWLVRTAMEREPQPPAVEAIRTGDVSREWTVPDLFHPEPPSGLIGEPPFGSWAPITQPGTARPPLEGLETPLDPKGAGTEGTEDGLHFRDLWIEPGRREPSPEPERDIPLPSPSPAPSEPEEPTLTLARLPECGQRPLLLLPDTQADAVCTPDTDTAAGRLGAHAETHAEAPALVPYP